IPDYLVRQSDQRYFLVRAKDLRSVGLHRPPAGYSLFCCAFCDSADARLQAANRKSCDACWRVDRREFRVCILDYRAVVLAATALLPARFPFTDWNGVHRDGVFHERAEERAAADCG